MITTTNQCRINANRGPWQLFALHTRDKDLSKLHPCQRVDTRQWHEWHSQPLESTGHAGNYFVPLSIRSIFIFFVAEVMSNYLTTDGLKKISLLPEAPRGLRPVAFATSATWLIRHCYYISRRQTTRGFELAENSRMCDYTVPGK